MVDKQDEQHEAVVYDRTMFGFWVYLMTDLLMFAILFACYSVLHNNTVGGESGRELFELPLALTETVILLTSSFTVGLAMLAARQQKKRQTLLWLGVTYAFGLAFLTIEISEFIKFFHEGHTLQSNAFLSSFFVLVGTHGLHITCGLLWMALTMVFLYKRGLNSHILRKISMLSLFWHFLDIVWIFIFTVVYLKAFV